MFDPTLLILLALAALGFVSHNTTVAISILVLIIVRVTPLNSFFPWIEKQGLTIGIIIFSSDPADAFKSARNCVRNKPGRSSAKRIARQPSAGFSSSCPRK